MIFYNFKLIIFTIILGALTLIYNNDCDGLYKNINYRNTTLVATKIRSLGELLHELTTNNKREKCKLREWKDNNETKYKKKQYPNDKAKRKQKIPEVTQKENTRTTNLKIYKNEKYDKEIVAKSNISSRSLKYLEMQRKLYNNFYVTPEIDFQKTSDKLNSKCCESTNKKKSSNKLPLSNKVHDNYLDNLKTGCVGGVGICGISSILAGNSGVAAGATASVAAAVETASTTIPTLATKLTSDIIGAKFFFISSLETAIKSVAPTLSSVANQSGIVSSAASAGTAAFFTYGMAIVALIAVTIIVILLYIWLRKRRKNSWKHEYKKHLCT
ncbi:stevor PIR protein, putative [Plasmodium sp. gorilla clade G2]|uniref:stevor PIR protein, putative n=1 Tax=Plasmodium sp. gorilla clade G2 TaxID=880535 RepID=UPI000D2269FC|nr:stevor PIR protein, putative [Plasmodium sp. gorilla clade G2]SOV10297.1 stevor PIR protein, putative [Plasmodium sp. gorilla clade G2]